MYEWLFFISGALMLRMDVGSNCGFLRFFIGVVDFFVSFCIICV